MRRILRSYRRIAHIEHHCDRCQNMIFPGDEYEGQVVLSDQYCGGRKVVVYKEHIFPMCDFPPDPFGERYIEDEEDVDLKQAA